MVSTDGRTDKRTDTEGYNIIPRHTLVAGYKNSLACVDDKTYAMTPPEAFNPWPPYTDSRTDWSQAVLLGQ